MFVCVCVCVCVCVYRNVGKKCLGTWKLCTRMIEVCGWVGENLGVCVCERFDCL